MSSAPTTPTADGGFSFRMKLILAFAAVYIIWGSTYLAIRFAIETLPGFTMSGVRFLIAGAILYGWTRLRGAPRPTWSQWKAAAIIGALLLLGGNGSVVWAQQKIPSGLAALLVGTEPLWVALLFWAWPGGEAPRRKTVTGLLIGFTGAAILAAPGLPTQGEPIHFPSVLAVLLACVTWALGSLYGRGAETPPSPAMGPGMQMLVGGSLLLTAGGLAGEWRTLGPESLEQFSTRSVAAFAYLIIFGSLIAFSCYSWLLRNARPPLVATYAYVNPVVAVFLGWLLAGEEVSARTFVAAALILGAVILVSTDKGHTGQAQESRGEISDQDGPSESLSSTGASPPGPGATSQRRRCA